MIVQMTGLPPGVLGFTAHNQVTAKDYEQVIVPDIEAAFAINPKLRVMFHTDEDFTGFDAGAMWDDAKLGFRHFSGWERAALVTDVGWIRTLARALGFLSPGQFRLFHSAELDDARAWVCTT
ncbi:STAS/SEC14 domain-containing protein [Dyella subtropica]|uniref:STAS/SEC14 domain-containing protein n=1 Tax=Dyella subtropica TaxID=2992127 RepID=UPI002257F809|nr:STAS/SEC14 domain-containing protein [Dyella subtropica]